MSDENRELRLPPLSVRPGAASGLDRLRSWLHEWDLDQRLAGMNSASPDTKVIPHHEPSPPAGDFDAEPAAEAGQIRLLDPFLLPSEAAPRYIALLEIGTEAVLVAPFSRFSGPATDGELLFERLPAGACVLCLWNATALPVTVAARTWFVDRLTESEFGDARAVWAHAARGESLPPRLHDRVAPPVLHPDDPRHAYLLEEAATMDRLTAEDAAADEPLSYHRDGHPREHRLAAEAPPEYGSKETDA